jgi:hypothetical protein
MTESDPLDEMQNVDYNELIDIRYRQKLNSQKNLKKLEGVVREDGFIEQPYRYALGLGESHFKEFEDELDRIIERFPWTKKKYFKFIMHELVLNTQISMLREFVRRIPKGKKAAGYFNCTININDMFCSAGIEEYGDFFDYYGFLDTMGVPENEEDYYDDMMEEYVNELSDLSSNKLKLILTQDDRLIVPDGSNRLGLQMIESATDQDFYVTSFYRDSRYMWKRVTFRIENE